jgi:hypothetical protein
MYTCVREFWRLTEPAIEAYALAHAIPLEIYDRVELGLHEFSLPAFQRRDPYGNPDMYVASFALLAASGWIEPLDDERYRVTERARQAAQSAVRAGDQALADLDALPDEQVRRLLSYLQRLVTAGLAALEPPERWASVTRFRIADERSPLLGQVRERLMDLFGYRDDAHLSAWSPLGASGPAWNAFGFICSGTADCAADIAARQPFRGLSEADYLSALAELADRGWIERSDSDRWRATQLGHDLRATVERLTDAYFYAPWACLSAAELDDLRALLVALERGLRAASVATPAHAEMQLPPQATFVCGHVSPSVHGDYAPDVPPATLRVGGAVAREQLLTLDALRALPAVTLTVPARDNSQPTATRAYSGVLLRDVLQHAGVLDDATRNNDMCGKCVSVVARDGYCITLAFCDLLIPFTHQRALLAFAIDDKRLEDVELVLPDDPNACRWAKHIVEVMLGDPRPLHSPA